jgi:hypothetical protein
MREPLNRRVVVAVSVGVIAVWLAKPEQQAAAPRPVPAMAATPYESPYPAPRVDPSQPPQEPAPTF